MVRPLWGLVLAAGAGKRLARITGPVPKQFFRPDGGASLLERTLERVGRLVPARQTVVVVDRAHERHLSDVAGSHRLGHLLNQPQDRGTAVGVLLGLMPIAESCPDAIVLLTPTDHGVSDSRLFHVGIGAAVSAVRSGQSDIVLFGAQPDSPTGDYGWITASSGPPPPVRNVDSFVEKPTPAHAARLLESGAVWNTMVMVARAQALEHLYRQHLPELAFVFLAARALPRADRDEFLAEQYPHLPFADFSRDLLTPARGLTVYTWPAAMGWSDLGTPERLEQWMEAEQFSRVPEYDPTRQPRLSV